MDNPHSFLLKLARARLQCLELLSVFVGPHSKRRKIWILAQVIDTLSEMYTLDPEACRNLPEEPLDRIDLIAWRVCKEGR